jgi:hypothetical protein
MATSITETDQDRDAKLRSMAISFAFDLSSYNRVDAILALTYAITIVLGNWDAIQGSETSHAACAATDAALTAAAAVTSLGEGPPAHLPTF